MHLQPPNSIVPLRYDRVGPSARTRETLSIDVRSSCSHVASRWPTNRTHQANASLRLLATPAAISVSSTSRSLIRRRDITGTPSPVNTVVVSPWATPQATERAVTGWIRSAISMRAARVASRNAAGSPSPGPASFDPTCTKSALPNLQDYINSLPAGSVFQSSTTACYLVPDGILLSKPITIIGGTFYDPLVERLTNVRPYGALHPIIFIKNTSHVTLSGVSVLGANTNGGYHADLVGEAGVKIMSSSDLVLTGVSAKNTFGDGLELVADFTDHINTPVNRLSVDGFSTIDAGRQGITVAELTNSTLNNLNVISPADSGIDFESDLPYQGSGNVAITNCVNEAGFNMVEYYTGPITVTNCTGFHHVTLRTDQKITPITFVGGTLTCKRAVPQPCIDVTGGSLTFTGVTIARMPGVIKISTPVWSVERAGTLRFDRSPIETGFGTVIDTASVNFTR